jgi:hypothetical protein
MNDLEEDYKIEQNERFKNSTMSWLLSSFIIHSFIYLFLMKILNLSLNI